jgi:2-polyprenyl-3-methyl-5-hydroxy-6-metoxy-1,4-benzoquinol methylase
MRMFRFDDLEANYTPHLPSDTSANILDVGCGNGRVLEFLRSKGFSAAAGVDKSPGTAGEVTDDIVAYLAAHAGRYDLLIVKDMIYYLPKGDVGPFLKRALGALKPGGRMIVEVFNGASLTGNYIGLKDPRIEWVPTEHSLRQLLEEAGFRVTAALAHQPPRRGLKRRAFNLVGGAWRLLLRAAYFAERGLDAQNPRIFTTKMLMVADRERS